jgi:hypothetical protein
MKNIKNRRCSMHDLVCEQCSEKFPVTGDSDWSVLVSLFPQHLLNCYVHLASGPSVLPCERCGHLTAFDVPQLVLGANAEAVLYIPDDIAPPDPARDDQVLGIVFRLRADAGPAGLTVARDRRSFRRGFIERFVIPAGDLTNQFLLTNEPALTWIEQHEAVLSEAFFAVCWLAASGAIPVFQVLADAAPASSFVPHEQAPPDANHVVKQHKAQQATAAHAGEILGWLLILWAMRSLEDRSFNRYRAAATLFISGLALSEQVCAAAAHQIGKWVSRFELGQQGAILGQYAFEAMLALLCQTHNKPNPRKEEWTRILLLYEFQRRLDGNDESMLLPPESVRATLDEPVFWAGVRTIERNLGAVNEESAPNYDHLLNTIERIFPGHAKRRFSLIPKAVRLVADRLASTGLVQPVCGASLIVDDHI